MSPIETLRTLRATFAMLRDDHVPQAEIEQVMPDLFLRALQGYGLPPVEVWDAPRDLRLRIQKIAAELQIPDFPTEAQTRTFRAESWRSTHWGTLIKHRPNEWRNLRKHLLIIPHRSLVGDDAPWKELWDRGQMLHEAF